MGAGAVIAGEADAILVDRDGSDYSLRSSAVIGTAPGIAEAIRSLVKASEPDRW
jgi:hypothetical protein